MNVPRFKLENENAAPVGCYMRNGEYYVFYKDETACLINGVQRR